MLSSLSNIALALVELVEAEVKSARKSLVQIAVAVVFVWLAATFLMAAVGLSVWAIYLSLVNSFGPGGAALICALIVALLAGGTLWLAKNQLR